MIFITIAATYTPISWLLLPRSAAITVLVAVWVGAFIGVMIMVFWPKAPQIVLVPVFLVVGWSALLVINEFVTSFSRFKDYESRTNRLWFCWKSFSSWL